MQPPESIAKVREGVKSEELTFTVSAFVRPGEYKVQVALIDSKTMEHSFTRRTLRVAPLKNDPLPDSWAGLPPVEVLPVIDSPDAWWLPEVKGLLRLPVASKPANTAPRVELLVNTTPSERSPNSAGSLRRNMSVVIPALKVLSALNVGGRPPSAAVMDLTRQRIGLETPNAGTLTARPAEQNAGKRAILSVIDAKSLAVQSSMRDYFVRRRRSRQRFRTAAVAHRCSGSPLTFNKQDVTPLPQLAPDPNRHIVYLRFLSAFRGGPMGSTGPPPTDVQIGPPERVRGPTPGLRHHHSGCHCAVAATWPYSRGRYRVKRAEADGRADYCGPETPESFRKTIADADGGDLGQLMQKGDL